LLAPIAARDDDRTRKPWIFIPLSAVAAKMRSAHRLRNISYLRDRTGFRNVALCIRQSEVLDDFVQSIRAAPRRWPMLIRVAANAAADPMQALWAQDA
jgi:hypothetical protein